MPGDVAQEQRVIRGHCVQFGKREMPRFGNGGVVIPRAEQPFPGGHCGKGLPHLVADVVVRPDVPDGVGIHVKIVFVVHARAHKMAVAVVEARHHEPPAEIGDAGFRALERGHFGFRSHGKDGFAGYGKAGNDGAAGIHRQDGAVFVDVGRLLHGWPHEGLRDQAAPAARCFFHSFQSRLHRMKRLMARNAAQTGRVKNTEKS